VLDTAKALGAPMIRIWPGWRDRASTDYDDADRAAAAAAIEAMGKLAEANNVSIGLECHPGTLPATTQSAMRLMAARSSPAGFLYWRPRPGMSKQHALEELDEVGDVIAYVHVFQWDQNSRRLSLEDGVLAWQEWLTAIPDGRYNGWRYALLEFVADDDVANFEQDAVTLRRLLAKQTVTFAI